MVNSRAGEQQDKCHLRAFASPLDLPFGDVEELSRVVLLPDELLRNQSQFGLKFTCKYRKILRKNRVQPRKIPTFLTYAYLRSAFSLFQRRPLDFFDSLLLPLSLFVLALSVGALPRRLQQQQP